MRPLCPFSQYIKKRVSSGGSGGGGVGVGGNSGSNGGSSGSSSGSSGSSDVPDEALKGRVVHLLEKHRLLWMVLH